MQKYLSFLAILGLFVACSPEAKEEKDEPISQEQEEIDEANVMDSYPG